MLDSKKQDDEAKQVNIGDNVLVNLVGRQSSVMGGRPTLDGPIFQQAKGWLVGIGDLDAVVKALEYGMASMKAGETAYIWSHSMYNFGPGIRKYKPQKDAEEYCLPPDSNVVYGVTVVQVVADTSRLNPYFPIQKALTRKNIANDIYQHEWESGGKARERAIRLYEKAAKDMHKLLEGVYFASVEQDNPQRKQCRQIMLDCFNNVVAIYMSAKRYAKAREAAEVVLKHDSKNLKALLRNAKAAMMDPSVAQAEADEAIARAEKVVVYKDKEEAEINKLRAQWKRRK